MISELGLKVVAEMVLEAVLKMYVASFITALNLIK